MIVFNKATTFGISVIFALLLWGCSEEEIDITSVEIAPTSTATEEIAGNSDGAGVADEPEVKSLRIGVNRELISPLSPDRLLLNKNFQLLIWSGLLRTENTGKLITQSAQVIPSYANEGISADGKTYTFLLRPNLKWNDGSRVTAELFLELVLDTLTSGGEFLPSYATDLATKIDVERSRHLDDRTFVIELLEPAPEFMTFWSSRYTYPTQTRFDDAQIIISGNGPYRLLEWTDDSVVFERDIEWQDYIGDIASHGIERIEFIPIDDFDEAFDDVVDADLDAISVSARQLNSLVLPADVIESWNTGSSVHAVFINNSAEIFDHKSGRASLAMNISRKELLDQLHAAGIGLQLKPSYSWIPKSVWGTSESRFLELESTSLLPADSWFIAGGADGSTIELLYSEEDPVQVALAPLLKIHWETTLPVDVVLRSERTEEYYADMVAGAYEIALGEWSQEYLDTYSWLKLFQSSSPENIFRFNDDEFDEYFASAVEARSQMERNKIFISTSEKLAEEVGVIPLFIDSQSVLLRLEYAALGETMLNNWDWKSFALND